MHSVSRENPVVAARELYSGLVILRARMAARMGGIFGRGLRPTNEIVANEGAPGVWRLLSPYLVEPCPGLQRTF